MYSVSTAHPYNAEPKATATLLNSQPLDPCHLTAELSCLQTQNMCPRHRRELVPPGH